MKRAILFLMMIGAFFTLHAAIDTKIIEITDKNFHPLIIESTEPVILDVYANWCGACRRMEPVFEEVSARHDDIVFAKLNVDTQKKLASRFGVRQLPTLLFFQPGNATPVMKSIGALSEDDLEAKISEFLNELEQK